MPGALDKATSRHSKFILARSFEARTFAATTGSGSEAMISHGEFNV